MQMFVYYCREPSLCMIVGSNKSYHSMKQSTILQENFDKPFAMHSNSLKVCFLVEQFRIVLNLCHEVSILKCNLVGMVLIESVQV